MAEGKRQKAKGRKPKSLSPGLDKKNRLPL
jgi:hypothetical protein